MWWSKFHKNQLKYTRGYLIELMHSETIYISNLTLLNSPAWNIHPVYSRLVICLCEKAFVSSVRN